MKKHIKPIEIFNYPDTMFQQYSYKLPQKVYWINPGINEKNIIIIWFDDEDKIYKLSTNNKNFMKEYLKHITAVQIANNQKDINKLIKKIIGK